MWVVVHFYDHSHAYDVVGPFDSEVEAEAWRDRWLPDRKVAALSAPSEVEEYIRSRM